MPLSRNGPGLLPEGRTVSLYDRLRVLAAVLDEAAAQPCPTQLLATVVAGELHLIADELQAGEERIAETLR
jgi:hypothetical protein